MSGARADRIARAIERREALLARLASEGTDCVRLFHGATEGEPGLAIDRYGPVLLVQTWREPLGRIAAVEGELDEIARAVERALGVALAPCWNHRGPSRGEGVIGSAIDPGDPRLAAPEGRELGARYDVRPRHRGQDPLLFLDLRAGRRRVRAECAGGPDVLNLFAYTCGVGVVAALGGAREVWNVDFAGSALAIGRANAARNGIDEARFRTIEEDAIPVVRQLAGLPVKGRGARRDFTRRDARTFGLVVLDPPRWARTPFGAIDVVRDYPSLMKPALLACAPRGAVLATNHVPGVTRAEWEAVLRRTAEKAQVAIGEIEWIDVEDDFPAGEGEAPLKMALVWRSGAT